MERLLEKAECLVLGALMTPSSSEVLQGEVGSLVVEVSFLSLHSPAVQCLKLNCGTDELDRVLNIIMGLLQRWHCYDFMAVSQRNLVVRA